jgi:uncharacterized membrane protein (DUF485 family)
MTFVKSPIIVVSIFLWIGFVCAISFMEAWLKFRAPGISVGLGLGIGRLVFNALNKVEWILALVILVNLFLTQQKLISFQQFLFFAPFILLIIQTVWLLPALDARAELHIQNQEVPPSTLHFYYVGVEIIKVASLGFNGILQFNKNPQQHSKSLKNFQI